MAYGPDEYVTITPLPGGLSGSAMAGMKHRFAVAGQITGIRVFTPSSGSGNVQEVYLFAGVGGAALASKDNAAVLTRNAWTFLPFDTPVVVTAGTTYVAAVWIPGSTPLGYDTSATYAGQTSGNVTVLASGIDGVQGTYNGTRDTCPLASMGAAIMGIAAVFQPLIASTPGRPKVYAGGSWTAKPAKVYAGGGYGTPQSGFGAQTPTSNANMIGCFGVDATFGVAGRVTTLRYYRHSTAAAAQTTTTLNMWGPTGTLLATAATVAESGEGWKIATLSTPLDVTAATVYRVSYDLPIARRISQIGRTGDLTNGDVTLGMSYYGGTSGTRPVSSEGSVFWFADVIFEAGTAAGWTEKPMKRHNGTTWVALT